MANKIIVLTEMGAAAHRKFNGPAKAGDLYTGKPSKSALRSYLKAGFVCEAIPVEDQGYGIFYDEDGMSYVSDGEGKIRSIMGEVFTAAAWDEHDNVTAIRAV